MNSADFQLLADTRNREAKILLDNQCYEGTYYLLGYAVECALKACIAKQTQAFDFPDKSFANSIFTHDLEKLMKLSGIEPSFQSYCKGHPNTGIFWSVVKRWTEEKRYSTFTQKNEADDLYEAINNPNEGVMRWIKTYW
jgi:hypothetical protein